MLILEMVKENHKIKNDIMKKQMIHKPAKYNFYAQ
jgi:hypothetical protein